MPPCASRTAGVSFSSNPTPRAIRVIEEELDLSQLDKLGEVVRRAAVAKP